MVSNKEWQRPGPRGAVGAFRSQSGRPRFTGSSLQSWEFHELDHHTGFSGGLLWNRLPWSASCTDTVADGTPAGTLHPPTAFHSRRPAAPSVIRHLHDCLPGPGHSCPLKPSSRSYRQWGSPSTKPNQRFSYRSTNITLATDSTVVYYTLSMGKGTTFHNSVLLQSLYEGHFLSKNCLRISPAQVIVRCCFKVKSFLYPSSKALTVRLKHMFCTYEIHQHTLLEGNKITAARIKSAPLYNLCGRYLHIIK
jgi:hypothetical protein